METPGPALHVGDRVAWEGTNLVVLDDELLERLNRPYLSASTAKALHSCPARWVGEKALPSGFDLFGATELGTAAHTVLERLFGLAPGRRDARHAAAILTEMSKEAPAADDDVDYTRAIGADPVLHTQWVAAVVNAYSGIFTIEDPASVSVHARELRLDGIEIAGVPFKGFIDRVDELPDGLGVVDFKGLALDTPIPTPSGWTTMGDLEVGDHVLGSDGRPVKVTVKSAVHNRPCYRVNFSDGTSVVCDNVHLWQVDDNTAGGRRSAVVDADALHELVARRVSEGHPASVTIPNIAPLDLPPAALPIDPYVLGAWLGDGDSTGSTITVGAQDLPDMLTLLKEAWEGNVQVESSSLERAYHRNGATSVTLTRRWPDRCGLGHESSFGTSPRPGRADVRQCRECSRLRSAARRAGQPFAIRGFAGRTNVPLRSSLKDAGLLGHKHIPQAYLRGSRDQRIALLQGLMDTDGYWNSRRGQAVFVTTLPAVADRVFELVSSLGVSANRYAVSPTRPGARTAHRVAFRPVGFNPFRLPRKAFQVEEVLGTYSTVRATRRVVTGVELTASVPTQCIAVDAPDSLYACGPGFSLCHNTGKDKSKPNKFFDDDHGDQIRLYVEALRVKLGEKPRAGLLYYIQHGTKRRVGLSATEINKTKRGFAESWRTLQRSAETRQFATRDSALCGWCPLVNACPLAAGNGRSDRKGGAPAATDLAISTLPAPGSVSAVPAAGPFAADPVRSDGRAAYTSGGDAPHLSTGGDPMSTTQRPWREAKPYDGPEIDGHLSLNSYAATAVFGLSTLAAELLAEAGMKVGPTPVKALAALLAQTVLDAQAEVTNGSTEWQEGANTRLRGALRSAIEVVPLPFGGDEAAWATWKDRAQRFMVAVAATAIDLYDNGPVVDLAALATSITPKAATTTPAAVAAAA